LFFYRPAHFEDAPMKTKIKLWLRKRALMLLGAIVWRLDDWVHRQQVRLREELSVSVPVEPPGPARPQRPTVSCPYPFPQDELLRHRVSRRTARDREPQRPAKKERHRVTAADFDRRFA
jgi:hypothetical protein